MLHRHRGIAALLATVVLAIAPPASIQAADGTATDGVAAEAALDTNLLRNHGFNSAPREGDPVPGWKVTGDVHLETFGTRAFPYVAYGAKYHGGKRYLSCYGGRGGSVSQTIDLGGRADHASWVKVRLATSLGGVTGHRVKVSIQATGGSNDRYIEKVRTLDVTNHYKKATVGYNVPRGTQQLTATIRLMPKAGSSRCKLMIDTAELVLFK
ncbi:MAG: hypothetical protein U0667_13105 [Chloroflexota bacterium]